MPREFSESSEAFPLIFGFHPKNVVVVRVQGDFLDLRGVLASARKRKPGRHRASGDSQRLRSGGRGDRLGFRRGVGTMCLEARQFVELNQLSEVVGALGEFGGRGENGAGPNTHGEVVGAGGVGDVSAVREALSHDPVLRLPGELGKDELEPVVGVQNNAEVGRGDALR